MTWSREMRRALEAENRKWPEDGREIPRTEWPAGLAEGKDFRIRVVRARGWLAQVFSVEGATRISVNRTSLGPGGDRWDEGFSWDELQHIKARLGFGDHWAVEIYPPRDDTVNVANMRHLWVVPEAPPFAWRRQEVR